MNVHAAIAVFAATVIVGQGAIALWIDPRGRINRLAAALATVLAAWNLAEGLQLVARDVAEARFWWRVSSVGFLWGSALMLHFVVVLTRQRGWLARRALLATVYLVTAVLWLWFLTTDALIVDFRLQPFGWHYVYNHGLGVVVFAAYYGLVTTLAFGLLLQWGLRASDRRERRQAFWVAGAGLLALGPATVTNMVLPLLGHLDQPPAAPPIFALWGLGVLWAIGRHRLLRLRPVDATEEIFRTAHEGMLLLDAHGHVAAINPAAEQLLGLSQQDLAKPLREVAPQLEGLALGVEQDVALQSPLPRTLAVLSSPVRDGETVTGRALMLRDVSAQREAARRLGDSEARFRELAEMLPGGVFEVDATWRLTYVNRGLRELVGADGDAMLGRPLCRVLGLEPETQERAASILAAASRRELMAQTADGVALPLVVHTSPMRRDGEVVGARGIAIDDGERRRWQERLLHTGKMEAVGRLASGIAHDFNNILAAILGYAEALSQSEERDEALLEEAVDGIQSATHRASDLTAQLLAFGQGGKHRLAPFDVRELLGELRRFLRHALDRRIEVELEATSDATFVLGDVAQFQQALMGLALNAQEAMPKGGTLRLETSVVELGEGPKSTAELAELPAGAYVKIEVIDDGAGIASELLSRVFEPFYTTKPQGTGSGMGLAMVYGIVRNHGGGVFVRSELGRGTTVELLVPRAEATVGQTSPTPAMALPAVRKPGAPPRGRGERILIVDDEPLVRKATSRLLEQRGYEPVAVEGGEEAIAYYREHRDQVAVVLLDLMMPGLDGRQTFEQLQALDPAVKVVLASGYGRDGAVQELLDLGVVAFMQKPFEIERLLGLFDGLLGRGAGD